MQLHTPSGDLVYIVLYRDSSTSVWPGFVGTSSDFIPPNASRRAPPAHEVAGDHAIQTYPTATIVIVYKEKGEDLSHPLLSYGQ